MGALLGALITGAIGITIMIVQLKKQEKSERVRELKYFYKSMFEFVHTVQSTVKQLMMRVQHLEDAETNIKRYGCLTGISKLIIIIKDEYSKIDDNAVLVNNYPTYLTINIQIDTIQMYLEDLHQSIEERDIKCFESNIKGMKVISESLNKNIEILQKNLEIAEDTLKIK